MFKNLGKIKYRIESQKVKIELDKISEGVNFVDEFIIFKKNDELSIYDRVCDHNSGKLISKNGKTFCPMHNWEFVPETGIYKNGLIKKKKEYEISNNKISVIEKKFQPEIKYIDKNINVKVRYINHAFLIIESDNFKFATDPWALGPAFNTGWWLQHKTIANWREELNSCNFIYISHNHPDHCHELTLSYLNKKIPLVVPNFITNSTGLLLQDLGFTNIHNLNFEDQYQFNGSELIFTIFKSGDLRDDSGFYFSAGKFKGLLTVDANNLNFLKLPSIDLFASSFAGGAHGYPLNCENYELEDRIKMLDTDRKFIRQTKYKYLEKIKPKFFLPYAGFFKEVLKRDEIYIKHNKKNLVNDYKNFCKKLNIQILNVEENTIFNFDKNKKVKLEPYIGKYYADISEESYLKYFKEKYQKIDLNYIKNYFEKSEFNDNSILFISLTDSNFEKSDVNFKINFTKKITFSILEDEYLKQALKNENNYLFLKIRKEAFLNTIYNKRSWEDISIGFQNRQYRKPNIYNSDFWFHFSNKYVSTKYVQSTTDCSNCTLLNNDIHNILFKKKSTDNILFFKKSN
jgi:CMP-N-acetylneuraminate monooxygenase